MGPWSAGGGWNDAGARANGSSENVQLTERYTRVSPDFINWEITVNAPATWTRPWTMIIRLKHVDEQVYEYACYEGNISLYGILAGARAQEKGRRDGEEGLELTLRHFPQIADK